MRHDQTFRHRAFRRSHKIIPSIVGAAAAATEGNPVARPHPANAISTAKPIPDKPEQPSRG